MSPNLPSLTLAACLTSSLAAAAAQRDSAPPPNGAVCYVDALSGRNTNAGSSPESAWQDFSNLNGRTLNAGDRLLIRRGSVINQELRLSARGTAERWVEIGAYGEGARPVIRCNWDIADRCALIRDPDFLRIHSLAFSHAGKGLVVHYATPGHQGLVIEDCVAHYLLRLVGDDGQLWMSDLVTAHILPPGRTLARAWEFNQPLDKEGWTEADLGTRERVETPIRVENVP